MNYNIIIIYLKFTNILIIKDYEGSFKGYK